MISRPLVVMINSVQESPEARGRIGDGSDEKPFLHASARARPYLADWRS